MNLAAQETAYSQRALGAAAIACGGRAGARSIGAKNGSMWLNQRSATFCPTSIYGLNLTAFVATLAEKKMSQNMPLWFEEARSAFDDQSGRLFIDDMVDEERFILVGMSSHSGLLVVVHCYRDKSSIIRIISARKATKRERQFYEEGI